MRFVVVVREFLILIADILLIEIAIEDLKAHHPVKILFELKDSGIVTTSILTSWYEPPNTKHVVTSSSDM